MGVPFVSDAVRRLLKMVDPGGKDLKNALFQSRKDEAAAKLEAENWRFRVIEKLQATDWKIIRKEVEMLIEDREELLLFTKENLLMLLEDI